MPEGRGKHYYRSRKMSLSELTQFLESRRKKEWIKKSQIFKKKEKENQSELNKQGKLQRQDSRKPHGTHGTHRGRGPGTAAAPAPGSAWWLPPESSASGPACPWSCSATQSAPARCWIDSNTWKNKMVWLTKSVWLILLHLKHNTQPLPVLLKFSYSSRFLQVLRPQTFSW